MNRMPVSVFILCIVKLQEFCYKEGITDYSALSKLLDVCCSVDDRKGGKVEDKLFIEIAELRNSLPFSSLSLEQEIFVYETFGKLRL